MTVRRQTRLQAAFVFMGLFAIYGCFRQDRDWNTSSRLLLTAGLVQDRSIDVTPYVSQNGQLLENPLTRDLAVNDQGRFFSDKAPGHSFWGAGSYALLEVFSLGPLPKPAPSSLHWPAEYWITWLTSGLATAATAALIVLLVEHLTALLRAATLAALGFGLATIAWPYATLYYGHSTAGFWALLTAFLLVRWPESQVCCLLAGLAAGCAVVTEYTLVVLPASVVIAEIGSGLWGSSQRPGRRLLLFIVGGIPLAVLLGVYHQAVTGSPFRFPYSMEVHDELFGYHKEGYGIPISLPDWLVIRELLWGTRRGLLWYSPVVFGAIPGLWTLVRRGQGKLATVAIGTFLGLFFINAGFPTWDGGWATGTRFLLPSFPLLLVATGTWLGTRPAGWLALPSRLMKCVWYLATGYGMAVMLGCTLAGLRFPPGVQNPISDAVLPSFREGRLVDNLVQWILRALGMPDTAGLEIVGLALLPPLLTALLLWTARRRERAREA